LDETCQNEEGENPDDAPVPFNTPTVLLDAYRNWMNVKNHPG
jgi:hypothetical protein